MGFEGGWRRLTGHRDNTSGYYKGDISGLTLPQWMEQNSGHIGCLSGINTYSGLLWNEQKTPFNGGHIRYHIQKIDPPHYWHTQDWVETGSGTKHWVIWVS